MRHSVFAAATLAADLVHEAGRMIAAASGVHSATVRTQGHCPQGLSSRAALEMLTPIL